MSVPAGDPRIGGVLARYRILEKLGEGGMGVVYRARDLDLGRDVALKLLPPGLNQDPAARERLLTEARMASRLGHPNICTIHEVGQADGQAFIAMELVEGRPLPSLIPPGGMSDDTVARIGSQLARALAHAHARGVVHRDLKTANVVIAPDGLAKLLDFGLSRRILDEGREPVPADSAEDAGRIAGTPQYLAPEVLMGARAGVSSDLWSLGVVLYEMCAGRLPFAGGPLAGMAAAILRSTPEPPPEHTSAGLRSVVMKCLAKDPAHRYARADEVAAALEALVPDTLPVAGGSAPPARRRRTTLRAPLGLAAALAVAAAAWLLWRSGGAPAAPHSVVLVLPLEVRGQVQDAEFAGRAFAEALAVNLAQERGIHVMPVPSSGEIAGAGTLARLRAAQVAGASRLVTGALTREGDSLRASVSLIDAEQDRVLWGSEHGASGADLPLLASLFASEIAERLGAPPTRRYDYFMYLTGTPEMATSPEMAEALGSVRRYELPHSLEATRRLVERFPREPDARVLRVAALLIHTRTQGPDPGEARTIADELEALRRLDPASPWLEVARALLASPGRRPIRTLGQVLGRHDLTPAARGAVRALRADAYAAIGDTARARADAEQAIRLDPASDLSRATLARVLAQTGRYREAAERVRQAIALNPTVANYWIQLGNCMLKQGRWEDYVADLDQAARLSPEADAILSAQCDGLSCVGRYREAADCARRALRLRPSSALYRLQLGLCLARLGRWEESAPLLAEACRQGLTAGCSAHAAALAVVRARAGDRSGARAQLQRSAASADTRSSVYALACAHALLGDRDQAVGLLERFPAAGWVEPGLERDPTLAMLGPDPRFQRVASWMRAQPIARVFSEWGSSR